MASRPNKATPPPPYPPLALKVPRAEAHDKIVAQVTKGEPFLKFTGLDDFENLEKRKKLWCEYVMHLLKSLFNSDEIANEFWGARYVNMAALVGSGYDKYTAFFKDSEKKINQLESILGRLELIPEAIAGGNATPVSKTSGAPSPANRKVFIVHGHDEAAKLAVALYLKAIDFEPIVLHEQANKSDTIIEKFERHADVGFAVVLLTPDDVGGEDKDNLHHRARQNVVAELGYFIGKLGRARVLPLKKGTVEIPTDFLGVLCTDMDDKGNWKRELSKELHVAGFKVDFEKATFA